MGRIWQIFSYFLKLGTTGFGGPVALVSVMHRDLIQGEGWIPEEEFKQTLTLIKAMPGAFAFQTACYLGYKRSGVFGATAAGVALIVPSLLITILLGSNYSQLRSQHHIGLILDGFQIAALALIIAATYQLAKSHFAKRRFQIFVLLSVPLFLLLPSYEPLLILMAGAISVLINRRPRWNKLNSSVVTASWLAFSQPDFSDKLLHLIWICFKAGAFVFGTGLAIVPLLENDFVRAHQYISHAEFMDAVAFGQLTPGPVLITVAWIGMKMLGAMGAISATFFVFLPGFIHMTTWFPRFSSRLLKLTWIEDFTFGALAFVIASLLTISGKMISRVDNPRMLVLLMALIFSVFKWNIKSWQILLSGGVAALLLNF